MVDAAALTKADKVLEIGPGLGPLTELLLERAGALLAIEKDARLVAVLRERFANQLTESSPAPPEGEGGAAPAAERQSRATRLELRHDDALELIKREPRDWTDWKLVANLPYSVASPMLVELAQRPGRPERMVVTLQLEVAHRLMAGAQDDDYGLLTLLVQLDYEPRGWFKIPADCFFPAPAVDSACVVLARRLQPLLAEEHRAAFVKVVKRALSQRRKMMAKLLKADWPMEKLQAAMAALKLSPQIRAEKLSLEQFVELTRRLDTP